jgi:hypothetical protein
MIAQSVTTTVLLRRSFSHSGIWSQVVQLVWLPLITGIVTALLLRHFIGGTRFDHAPRWWYVGGLYFLAAGTIFVAVVAISQLAPQGAACWRDLRLIASRFLSLKAT